MKNLLRTGFAFRYVAAAVRNVTHCSKDMTAACNI